MYKNDWRGAGDFLSLTMLTNERGCDRIKSGREHRPIYHIQGSPSGRAPAIAGERAAIRYVLRTRNERGRKRKRGTIGGEEKRRKKKN